MTEYNAVRACSFTQESSQAAAKAGGDEGALCSGLHHMQCGGGKGRGKNLTLVLCSGASALTDVVGMRLCLMLSFRQVVCE